MRTYPRFASILTVLVAYPAVVVAAQLQTAYLRFTIAPDSSYELWDKKAQIGWHSETDTKRIGEVTLLVDGKPRRIDLTGGRYESEDARTLIATFNPLPEQPKAAVVVRTRLLQDGKTLEIAYSAHESMKIESVSLFDRLLTASDAGQGYVIIPVREGLLIPANSGLAFEHRFDTSAYEGCHMQMIGAVENGAAILATWLDPYVAAQVRSITNVAGVGCHQRVTAALGLRKSAFSFNLKVLGKGDYVTVAKAYREVAAAKGLVVPWSEKLKTNPERAKLFGAANIKLWSALTRRMNEDSTKEESVRVSWTFAEAAQVAEHLKRDLKLEKVLFTIGGWIHRGYDNQHPDILPTVPECGGDAAFADCARRVMDLGYLFCLHDNYQDIYRDSPSWNEKYVMKSPDGKLVAGGHWAGGRAYLTCSKMALELAQRPQNLTAVKKLCNANSYFIDTTYASGLQECFDPNHPLARADDMKWKEDLSDHARQIFGVFGSECGREWAIPHSDFFEGLTGVSGTYYADAALPAKLGATVVPLFELVYRDCIAMYGKYGYNPARAATYVLHHLTIGRPLNYHSIPSHRYWMNKDKPESRRTERDSGPASPFTSADNGWAEGLHPTDIFIKNTCEVLCPLNELTAQMQMTEHQFLTPDRKVQRSVFGSGAKAVEVIVNGGTNSFVWDSKSYNKVELPPFGFAVASPTFAAFHALSWNGVVYRQPVMFSLRSLDGRALPRSRQVRVFHAFGREQVRVNGNDRQVRTEAVLNR